MKLIHFSDAKPFQIADDTGQNLTARMVIDRKDGTQNVAMRIFELGMEGSTPWFFLEWDHQFFIHSGVGKILYKDKWTPMGEGYAALIPKHEAHQIRNTGKAPLVMVSLLPIDALI